MTESMPRFAIRPNPDSAFGYDVYVHDDGNAWTGWLRVEYVPTDMDDPTRGGVLTEDGQRDLIELLPGETEKRSEGSPPGVLEMSARLAGQQQCAIGNHIWTPWLLLPNDSYVTCCARTGCGHEVGFKVNLKQDGIDHWVREALLGRKHATPPSHGQSETGEEKQ